MQTFQTYSALFWLNKARMHNNEAPIFLRITVNGKRAEVSMKRFIAPECWNSDANKAKGNTEKDLISTIEFKGNPVNVMLSFANYNGK